jgi:hypothetical protein
MAKHQVSDHPLFTTYACVQLLLFPAGFLLYSFVAVGLILWLIFWVAPEHGQENVLVYLGICSLAGSFTVTSCKVGGSWSLCVLAVADYNVLS